MTNLGIEARIPICTMEERTFEAVQAGNLRPIPLVQDPYAGHEDVAFVFDDLAGVELQDLDSPS